MPALRSKTILVDIEKLMQVSTLALCGLVASSCNTFTSKPHPKCRGKAPELTFIRYDVMGGKGEL